MKDEIFGVKVCDRWTDRQTDQFFDNINGGMWIFISVKFATYLLASLAGSILGNDIPKPTEARWHIGMSSASYWDPWRVLGSNPGKGEYCFHLRLIA